MEFKPNSVTQAEATAVVQKFKDYNKGVVVGKPYTKSRDWDGLSAKWIDLINPSYCRISDLEEEMMNIYRRIRFLPEDEILGDLSVEFIHITDRNVRIPFYWKDKYILLREAIKERKASQRYKEQVAELEKERKFQLQNTSKDTLLEKSKARIAELEMELGQAAVDVSSTSNSQPQTTV